MTKISSRGVDRSLLCGSAVLNVGLTATVMWLVREQPAALPARTETVVKPRVKQAASSPAPKPFRWSQIESTNYFTYVQNLRRIGCPEQTIRDLVQGELAALYESRRSALTQEVEKSPEAILNLQRLDAERATVFSALVGPVRGPEADGMMAPTGDTRADLVNDAKARREKFLAALQRLALPADSIRHAETIMNEYVDKLAQQPAVGGNEAMVDDDVPKEVFTPTERRIRTLFGAAAFAAYQREMRRTGP